MIVSKRDREVHASTNTTCPYHIWKHEVVCLAKVSVAEAKPWADKVKRAFFAGEPIWMAAEALNFFVRESAVGARARADSFGDLLVRGNK